MKKLNQKGFTLIELLAVIVILAILIAVAVPAVTKYLGTAKKGSYTTNANAAIAAVRGDVVVKQSVQSKKYTLTDINTLLDRKLTSSPYGSNYDETSYVQVDFDENGIATYSICLIDEGGNGIYNSEGETTSVKEADINDNSVKNNLTSGTVCR